jgi:transcription termination factor Rho
LPEKKKRLGGATPSRKTVRNQKEIEQMINSLMGIAWSYCGHITTHKLLSGIVDVTTLGCKKQLAGRARTWEDK